MNLRVDPDRLLAAYNIAKTDLLGERVAAGHWIGELASSALSTATAVSALSLAEKQGHRSHRDLIDRGIAWLADHQNDDGGWGDTDQSHSNIATTMLVVAAMHLAGAAPRYEHLLKRANSCIDRLGRLEGLRRRYGRDKTFAVPILTNCALAGLVDWREVSPLPFEAARVPQRWYRFLGLPVVSYAVPALVAIGQARHYHAPSRNPLLRGIRQAAVEPTLRVLQTMQPASGGFLEATPLTSFVVMSLISAGRAAHPVARQGLAFLINSVREDGSWPIDTNLATWNTTLAINALAAGGEDVAQLPCLDWLLSCQGRETHPYTGAAAGAWGWSDLSGSVPDADDTPGALLALAAWRGAPSCSTEDRQRIDKAAAHGVRWLLDLQNRDGGWPTFCRGWTKQVFDRSGADLTAHALRALHVWKDHLPRSEFRVPNSAFSSGLAYLGRQQRPDGSWIPLWFGNQDHPEEENPIYGTSKVLLAWRDLGKSNEPCAQRGFDYLTASQNEDGSWGGGPSCQVFDRPGGSVEETALALEALLGDSPNPSRQTTIDRGLSWLVAAVESGRHRRSWPIGFYFAKLWYYERLYPLTFTACALGRAVRELVLPALRTAVAPCVNHEASR